MFYGGHHLHFCWFFRIPFISELILDSGCRFVFFDDEKFAPIEDHRLFQIFGTVAAKSHCGIFSKLKVSSDNTLPVSPVGDKAKFISCGVNVFISSVPIVGKFDELLRLYAFVFRH